MIFFVYLKSTYAQINSSNLEHDVVHVFQCAEKRGRKKQRGRASSDSETETIQVKEWQISTLH